MATKTNRRNDFNIVRIVLGKDSGKLRVGNPIEKTLILTWPIDF